MMNKSTVIIVSGLPASGKTLLGHKLEEKLHIPLYGKDQFKELLFDTLGWKDRKWSIKIGDSSLEILYAIIANEVACGRSVMVEGSFRVEVDKARFEKLIDQYDFEVIEVLCEANGETLWERFQKRAKSGARHPGHRDKQNLDKYKDSLLTGEAKPLGLGKVFRVNTEDMSEVDYDQITSQICQAFG